MNQFDPTKAYAVRRGVAPPVTRLAPHSASRANRVSSEADRCHSGYVPHAHPLTTAHPMAICGRTIGWR